MCRLLALKSDREINPRPHLEAFAKIAQISKEYQGHGWGISWTDETGAWQSYHSLSPVWEENDFNRFPHSKVIIAHARSAFQDEGIIVENNMPFHNDNLGFIFNGELRGVRLNIPGRIGAEKVFNLVQRMSSISLEDGIERAIEVIDKRSGYIRAMNFVIADAENLYVTSFFNEDPEYFNLHVGVADDITIVSSVPYQHEVKWRALDNYSVEVYQ